MAAQQTSSTHPETFLLVYCMSNRMSHCLQYAVVREYFEVVSANLMTRRRGQPQTHRPRSTLIRKHRARRMFPNHQNKCYTASCGDRHIGYQGNNNWRGEWHSRKTGWSLEETTEGLVNTRQQARETKLRDERHNRGLRIDVERGICNLKYGEEPPRPVLVRFLQQLGRDKVEVVEEDGLRKAWVWMGWPQIIGVPGIKYSVILRFLAVLERCRGRPMRWKYQQGPWDNLRLRHLI